MLLSTYFSDRPTDAHGVRLMNETYVAVVAGVVGVAGWIVLREGSRRLDGSRLIGATTTLQPLFALSIVLTITVGCIFCLACTRLHRLLALQVMLVIVGLSRSFTAGFAGLHIIVAFLSFRHVR